MTKNKKNIFIIKASLIAALYISFGLIFKAWDFGAIQLRPAEALNILVLYTDSAPLGLFLGCFINNLSSPFGIIDIFIGSISTLCAASIGRRIHNRYLCLIPSVIINAVSVPFTICFASGTFDTYSLYFFQIFASQLLSVYIIGLPLSFALEKSKSVLTFIKD